MQLLGSISEVELVTAEPRGPAQPSQVCDPTQFVERAVRVAAGAGRSTMTVQWAPDRHWHLWSWCKRSSAFCLLILGDVLLLNFLAVPRAKQEQPAAHNTADLQLTTGGLQLQASQTSAASSWLAATLRSHPFLSVKVTSVGVSADTECAQPLWAVLEEFREATSCHVIDLLFLASHVGKDLRIPTVSESPCQTSGCLCSWQRPCPVRHTGWCAAASAISPHQPLTRC